ncbi:class I SAM-dependent methyltransferase [Actinoplanes sp. LDG1-06]|uniref:Class I SAM-dependent methyltransferase n=1 Tax=Paractinoplanes ovalisporus TaxID=2810368 RepID=A0ABS2A7P8_9ACTN|nr:class I SAM-dependent methyltransferase [Actinoplanes ovalisporus]MBM2615856.1 class I SAM-dependent methyltransferase [Actinoplanes ovalisporus]
MQSLSSTVRNRVAQIVPFAPQARSASAFSGRLWRHVAQSFPVERYYLFPSGEENRRQAQLQVDEDQRYDLYSAHLPVTSGGWSASPPVPMNTLWLIDDEVVVRQEASGRGAGSWLVTVRPSEVQRARDLVQTLRDQVGMPAAGGLSGPDITQWLLESAEKVFNAAQLSCTGSEYIDDKDCEWYHGAWQYLRLLDMVSSPTWHPDFYARELRAAIHERGARRILISGAADWTTLAFVLDAAKLPSGDPVPGLDVHVVDLCPTPLMSCSWFTRRWGDGRFPVTTHQANVLRTGDLRKQGVPPEGSFDLVVADAFLTRFAPVDARRVLRKWYKLLRPGGSVVTTVRLHARNRYPDRDGADPEFDGLRRVTNQVDDFELRLRDRAGVWQDMLSIDLEDLSRAGRRYAKRIISHDLGDADHIATAFKDQRFHEICMDSARVQGELVGTEYARITAVRPGSRAAARADKD